MKKKILTVAVAAGMLAAGSAQALKLGQPGGALLVPLARLNTTAGSVENTMVQITVGSLNTPAAPFNTRPATQLTGPNGYGPQGSAAGDSWDGNPVNGAPGGFFHGAATLDPGQVGPWSLLPNPTVQALSCPNLHWYWFNPSSVHRYNGPLCVSANDQLLFDWNATISLLGQVAVDEVSATDGYLLFASEAAATGALASNLILWGDAMIIQGNWLSAAYIPVIGLNDAADPAGAVKNCSAGIICDEVTYGVNPNINPWVYGWTTGNGDGVLGRTVADMPYFVPTGAAGGLAGETDLVVWADQNYNGAQITSGPYGGCLKSNWAQTPILVFDTEESRTSSAIDLSKELNVIDVATQIGGARRPVPDAAGVWDAGFIYLNLQEASTSRPDAAGLCAGNNVAANTSVHGGVGFSMVYLLGGNIGQVQTELLHERGIINGVANPAP